MGRRPDFLPEAPAVFAPWCTLRHSSRSLALPPALYGTNQVEQLLEAAREDEIGTYAIGAMERVTSASEDAIKTIKSSTTR